MLEPSAKIHPDYAATIVITKSGGWVQGILRLIGDVDVEITTSSAERSASLATRSRIRSELGVGHADRFA